MDKSEILALRRAVLEKDFARMNDRQKQAVFTVNGPLLILAGAGSGKTTVLINRIANILRYAAHNGNTGAFECFRMRTVAHHGYYLHKQSRRRAERPPVCHAGRDRQRHLGIDVPLHLRAYFAP